MNVEQVEALLVTQILPESEALKERLAVEEEPTAEILGELGEESRFKVIPQPDGFLTRAR